MNTLIIYGSQYGTTKRYADKFAEMTKFPIINYENVKSLDDYNQIIYFGGLYAGGIKGLKSIIKKIPLGTKLIIVTVGLADVTDKENIIKIRNSIKKQIPEHLFNTSLIFNLRGGIDYNKLNFKHKTMMRMLRHFIKKKSTDDLSQEDKDFLESYNKKVDFVDFDSLKQILNVINK